MSTPLEQLLGAARGPLGPPVRVDLGTDDGPLQELSWMLGTCNGFYLYNAGIQVYRAGSVGVGPDLATWNHFETWKETYTHRVRDLFCFAQDLFGIQFAIVGNEKVVAFDPETAERTVLGTSLQHWAQWLLDEPDVRTAGPLATAWQNQHGPLDHHQRLLPKRWFVFGGSYDLDNLQVADAVEAMRA